MNAALSTHSCCLSCLRHGPGDTDSDRSGSTLSLQTPGHQSTEAAAKPKAPFRMSEGDVTLLNFGPASLDLSRQDQRSLIRLYCKNGGYHLRILSNGTVVGGRDDISPHGEEDVFLFYLRIERKLQAGLLLLLIERLCD